MSRLKTAFLSCSLIVAAALTGCTANTPSSGTLETAPPSPTVQTTPQPESGNNPAAGTALRIQVGDRTFPARLEDTPAAQALADILPMTLNMEEMNGNEKYFFLPDTLPTDPKRPNSIAAGDLMLYGDNCLVLFYESFQSTYSYTRLGAVTDTSGLAEALGSGSVPVRFDLSE